jgi:nephrocystin-3
MGFARSQSRTARIFLSSTFRDFGEERDLLVRRVFPALRARLRDRLVELVDVDLRWGITAEQAERGEVLPICLAEIDRARPYFIGMLGARYGWVPPAEGFASDLVARQPWLRKHQGGKSVTELEILHGVLNQHKMRGRAFFYFRLTGYARQKGGDYLPSSAEDRKRQEDLKRRIRASGNPVVVYRDPEALAKRLEKDLWALLDAEFPASEVPDAFTRESMRHEAYAEPRRRLYLGGERYQAALSKALDSGEQRIVIEGASGGGKSALLANFLEDYQRRHPKCRVHSHYLGASADAADPVALVRRLITFIQRTTGSEEAVPVESQALLDSLPGWLNLASVWAGRRKTRFLLVLDALNSLTDRRDLRWWPAYLPARVQMVVSCLPGATLEALKVRTLSLSGAAPPWRIIRVKPLSRVARRTLFTAYLARFNKVLPALLTKQVMGHALAGNPLFLRTLAEELRLFGVHEALQARIAHYLESRTVDDLFERVLARVEGDCGKKAVKATMTALWASRNGLAEPELLGITGLAPAVWAPIRNALEEGLLEVNGRLTFAHDYLRIGVSDRYLRGNGALGDEGQGEGALAARRQAHATVAKWFAGQEADGRVAEELPWQWRAGCWWRPLRACLTTRAMFEAMVDHRPEEELLEYWLELEARTPVRVEQAYANAWRRWRVDKEFAETGSLASRLGSFLQTAGRYGGFTERMRRLSLAIAEKVQGPEHPETGTRLNNLALLLDDQGDYAAAEPLYRRALAIAEKALGAEHPQNGTSLNNLASLLRTQGDYAAAEPLFRRALAMAEKALGPEHPDTGTSLNNLAILLNDQGDYAGAEPLYRRALAIAEKVQGPEHPDTGRCLNNLAILLNDQGEYAGAEPLYRRALAIAEKALGPEHPSTGKSLNNLALLFKDQGDYAGAEPLYRRALAIAEKALGAEHPETGTSLSNLALLLDDQGDYAAAEPLYRRALAIAEKALGVEHPQTGTNLSNLASLLEAQGDCAAAVPLYRRALAIAEKVSGPEHPNTGSHCWALGNCLSELGRTDEAVQLLTRELRITQGAEGADSDSAARTSQRLGVILRDAGKLEEAQPPLEAALHTFESIEGRQSDPVAGVLNALGQLAALQRNFALAIEHFTEALAIRRAASPENLEGSSLLEARLEAARAEQAGV